MLAAFAVAAQTTINARWDLEGIVALVAGIVILIFPRVLNYIVAAYLIFIGLVRIFNVHF